MISSLYIMFFISRTKTVFAKQTNRRICLRLFSADHAQMSPAGRNVNGTGGVVIYLLLSRYFYFFGQYTPVDKRKLQNRTSRFVESPSFEMPSFSNANLFFRKNYNFRNILIEI